MIPSPVQHPNAYAGFSVATAVTLIIEEADRFGVAVSPTEAGFIVGVAIYFALLLGKRVKLRGN